MKRPAGIILILTTLAAAFGWIGYSAWRDQHRTGPNSTATAITTTAKMCEPGEMQQIAPSGDRLECVKAMDATNFFSVTSSGYQGIVAAGLGSQCVMNVNGNTLMWPARIERGTVLPEQGDTISCYEEDRRKVAVWVPSK